MASRTKALHQSVILTTIEVANVKALFQEYEARRLDFAQRLVRQAWGGLDFLTGTSSRSSNTGGLRQAEEGRK